MELPPKVWIVSRILISCIDVVTDVVDACHLMYNEEVGWGLVTLFWVVFGVSVSTLVVFVGRWRTGDPMPVKKYVLLTLAIHANIVEAFVESGPEVVVQLMMLWKGVHREQFQVLLGPISIAWSWAWFQLLCLLTSFISLVTVGLKINSGQKHSGLHHQQWSQLLASIILILSASYRLFVYSIIMTFSPDIATISIVSLYVINCMVLHQMKFEKGKIAMYAYFSSYFPVIQDFSNRNKSKNDNKNQAKTRTIFICHFIQNQFLMIPYICGIEQNYSTDTVTSQLIPLANSRLFLYLTPQILLTLLVPCILLYIKHIRNGKKINAIQLIQRTESGTNDPLMNPHGDAPRLLRCLVKDSRNERSRKRWMKEIITWRITRWPSGDLSKEEVSSALGQAFSLWMKHANIKFNEVKHRPPDIEIKFVKRNHGHGFGNEFDGIGGTLAHALFPQHGGDICFDDDEHWTTVGDQGTNLTTVAVHEIGHSLGLDHSPVPDAIMFPTYKYFSWLHLHEDDIKRIQSLYGKPVSYPTRP